MSYPYPTPGDGTMEMSQQEYMPAYALPSQNSSMPPTIPDGQALAADYYKDPSHALRRSFSTPNTNPFQPLSHDDSHAAGPGEKKRNRLGYHRTSVACGHCRRRKIRCVPAANDPQGRCSNCIRLKKDCTFFPVDQPGGPSGEARSKSSSKQTPSASQAGSESPSPSMSGRSTQDLKPRSSSTALATASSQSIPPTAVLSSHDPELAQEANLANSMGGTSQQFAFNGRTAADWVPSDAVPSVTSEPINGHAWAGQDLSLGSQYNAYPRTVNGSYASEQRPGVSRGDLSYPGMNMPLRSMSYAEGMGHAQPIDTHHLGHPSFADRRNTTIPGGYNVPLELPVSNPGPNGSVHMGNAPLSDQMGWHQPTQHSHHFPYHKQGGHADGWIYPAEADPAQSSGSRDDLSQSSYYPSQ